MLIINVNGPINSGKSTVSKVLAASLENVLFIEVDDLLSDEEQDDLGLGFWDGINLRLDRLDKYLEKEIQERNFDIIIFAYPLTQDSYNRWQRLINSRSEFKSVTLAPDLDTCLKNRGTRSLTMQEINRIKDMYAESYHRPKCTDLIVNNTRQSPEETAQEIIDQFSLSVHKKTI